jgi:hypothetical protein
MCGFVNNNGYYIWEVEAIKSTKLHLFYVLFVGASFCIFVFTYYGIMFGGKENENTYLTNKINE